VAVGVLVLERRVRVGVRVAVEREQRDAGANSAAAPRCTAPSDSPSHSIASSAPKNGALANTLCARVAPSDCAAEIVSAMLAP
jgi:hypothetical protein